MSFVYSYTYSYNPSRLHFRYMIWFSSMNHCVKCLHGSNDNYNRNAVGLAMFCAKNDSVRLSRYIILFSLISSLVFSPLHG